MTSLQAISEPKRPKKQRMGMRARVNAFCRYCIYDPHAEGNWRQQVDGCPAKDCPLWDIRPRSKAPLA